MFFKHNNIIIALLLRRSFGMVFSYCNVKLKSDIIIVYLI